MHDFIPSMKSFQSNYCKNTIKIGTMTSSELMNLNDSIQSEIIREDFKKINQ